METIRMECALAISLVAAVSLGADGGSLKATGAWRVQVEAGGRSAAFEIEPTPKAHVDNEAVAQLPAANPRRRNWSKPCKLKGVIACECSVRGALDPASVIVRTSDGKVLERNRDYLLEPAGWGGLEAAPGSPFAGKPVTVAYAYWQQRIDSIVTNANGVFRLLKGEPHVAMPKAPEVGGGETRIANIWLYVDTRRLSEDNINPILEDGESFRRATARPAVNLFPKTWKKLSNGERVKILAWGDSVTDAAYLPLNDKWQEQFVRRLRQRFPKAEIELVSNGWGGRRSTSFLGLPPSHIHNYERTVLGEVPDLIVSEFVNDCGMGAKTKEQYARFLEDFRRIGAEWIILTPHYTRPDWMGLKKFKGNDEDPRPYVKAVREFGKENGVAVADAAARWGHLWREGVPFMSLFHNNINHPDAFGMSLFADALMDLLP